MKYIYKNKDSNDLIGEIWKNVDGFNGYMVSNLGRVKNGIGHILTQSFSREYLILGLTRIVKNQKERKTVRVHRLVAQAFCGGLTDEKNTVNHIDNVKTNNISTNLEWSTMMENKRSSYKSGQNKYKHTPDDVRKVRLLKKEGMLQKDIALEMNMTTSTVSDIINKKKWSYID